MREAAPKLIIVITDGKSDNRNQTTSEAQRLKSRDNVKIVSVGIGEDVDMIELVSIVSDPLGDVYKLDDLDRDEESGSLKSEMIRKFCQLTTGFSGVDVGLRAVVVRSGYRYFKVLYEIFQKTDPEIKTKFINCLETFIKCL